MTQQELKDHVIIHQPFRPQCPFTNCEKLFSSLQGLYDHEWRHYIPAPQKDELELGPSKQMEQNSEAPWKQRVRVEEIWLQSKKGQKESLSPESVSETSNLGVEVNEIKQEPIWDGNIKEIKEEPAWDGNQDLSANSEIPFSHEDMDDIKPPINGHEDVTSDQASESKVFSSQTNAAAATPRKRCQKRTSVELDPLNVKDLEDMSTLAEGVQQKLGEPHITEHKSFKPEDPSYAPFVKAPFIRPPPSTYLDESLLSMRKRRSTEEAAQKKYVYWNTKKKKDPDPEKEQQVNDVAPEQKIRQRCGKCLSSFGSVEELQKHQALNTCSALFGFDSDDESKYTWFTDDKAHQSSISNPLEPLINLFFIFLFVG